LSNIQATGALSNEGVKLTARFARRSLHPRRQAAILAGTEPKPSTLMEPKFLSTHGRAAIRLFVAVLALSGCAARYPSPAELPSEQFSGHLTRSGDGYWFQRCNAPADSLWWVTFVGESVNQLERRRERGAWTPGQRAFVRWDAALTDERHVGPGGPALLVRNIIDIRAASAADCVR
jgi:hypothetical protein